MDHNEIHLDLDVIAQHAERCGITLAEAEDYLLMQIVQGRPSVEE